MAFFGCANEKVPALDQRRGFQKRSLKIIAGGPESSSYQALTGVPGRSQDSIGHRILAALAILVWVGALLFPLGLLSGLWALESAKQHRARAEEIEALRAED